MISSSCRTASQNVWSAPLNRSCGTPRSSERRGNAPKHGCLRLLPAWRCRHPTNRRRITPRKPFACSKGFAIDPNFHPRMLMEHCSISIASLQPGRHRRRRTGRRPSGSPAPQSTTVRPIPTCWRSGGFLLASMGREVEIGVSAANRAGRDESELRICPAARGLDLTFTGDQDKAVGYFKASIRLSPSDPLPVARSQAPLRLRCWLVVLLTPWHSAKRRATITKNGVQRTDSSPPLMPSSAKRQKLSKRWPSCSSSNPRSRSRTCAAFCHIRTRSRRSGFGVASERLECQNSKSSCMTVFGT